jgi:hypothetical protein
VPRIGPWFVTNRGGIDVSDLITLEELDADGAIREAGHAVDPEGEATRAAFFRRAAIGGGALVAGGVVFGPRRLPEMGRGLDKGIRDFRDGITGDDARTGENRRAGS